jgi:hypothetical protein
MRGCDFNISFVREILKENRGISGKAGNWSGMYLAINRNYTDMLGANLLYTKNNITVNKPPIPLI